MSQPNPARHPPVPERPEAAPSSAAAGEPADVPPTLSAGSRPGLWLGFVCLSVLGGVAGGLLVDRTTDLLAVEEPKEVAGSQGILNSEQRALVDAAQVRADFKNTSIAIGLLGLTVGAVFGLKPGLSDRSLRMAVGGVAVGALAGALLGAAGGLAAVFIREQLGNWNTLAESGEPDPLLSQLHAMAIQLPSWISIAVAAGVAVGGRARRGRLILRTAGLAICAVLFASFLYPILASILFPMDDPGGVIPRGTINRLFWTTLHCGLLGLIAGRPAPVVSAS